MPALSPVVGMSSRDRLSSLCSATSLAASVAVVAALSWFELASVDLGYHLAYGRHFIETGRIVEVDPFIYAAGGHRFVNANWGGQVVFALVEKWGGASALSVLKLLLLGGTFVGVALLARVTGGAAAAVSGAIVLAGLASYERFDLRPELFSYLCFTVQLCLLARPPRRSWVAGLATFGVQVMWVNLHSYFLVAPIAAFAWTLGDAATRIGRGSIPEDARVLRTRLVMLAAQVVACLVNPWGIRGALFPISTLALLRRQGVLPGADDNAGSWAGISEFRSPFAFLDLIVSGRTIHAYFAVLAIVCVGIAIGLVRRRWGEVLVMALLATMSFSMRRNIPLVALGAVPIAAGLLAGAAARVSLAGAGRRVEMLSAVVFAGLAVWWVPRIVTGRFYFDELRPNRTFGSGFSWLNFPHDACAWMRSQPDLKPRFFADFYTSSNCLTGLPAGWQVFVTTNTFAYPPEALAEIGDITIGRKPYDEFFDRWGVNVLLLHAGSATKNLLGQLTTDEQWAPVWFDRSFVVFARRIPEHAELIAVNEKAAASVDVDALIDQAMRRSTAVPGFELSLIAALPLALDWNGPAVRLLTRAVELEPGFAQAWQNLGTAHGQLAIHAGRAGESVTVVREHLLAAKACFERALRLDPSNAVARRNLELALQGLNATS